jgi:hypothetical protein
VSSSTEKSAGCILQHFQWIDLKNVHELNVYNIDRVCMLQLQTFRMDFYYIWYYIKSLWMNLILVYIGRVEPYSIWGSNKFSEEMSYHMKNYHIAKKINQFKTYNFCFYTNILIWCIYEGTREDIFWICSVIIFAIMNIRPILRTK